MMAWYPTCTGRCVEERPCPGVLVHRLCQATPDNDRGIVQLRPRAVQKLPGVTKKNHVR